MIIGSFSKEPLLHLSHEWEMFLKPPGNQLKQSYMYNYSQELMSYYSIFNPFKPNGFPTLTNRASPYLFKGCWVVFFIFIQILIDHYISKKWRPWLAASYLGLHSALPMSHKKDARLIWFNMSLE